MKIYSYHPETGQYIGESIADESPLEQGIFLIPSMATNTPPPPVPDGREAIFVDGEWTVELIQLATDPNQVISDPFSSFTPAQLLARHKANKAVEIKSAAGTVIVSGIAFNALGYVCTYPTTRDDQVNLNGLVTESLLPSSGDAYKFWCSDSSGIWARRIHTKLQIQELGKAVADHVKTQQEKYEQKLNEIALADADAIDLISW